MHLSEMLKGMADVEVAGETATDIQGISYDSRRVARGHLFVAIKGEKTDGNLYVGEALSRGAAAIASEDTLPSGAVAVRVPNARRFLAEAAGAFYRHPAAAMKLVGITGTNGKTTTSYLTDAIFRAAGVKSCLVGTIGMRIGTQPFPTERTTPESSDLLEFLRRACDAHCTHGVMEVSSHALQLDRVHGVKFTVGVFSNLTPDHLDFHGDMETYYAAKRRLFVEDGRNDVEVAAINADDPYGARLAAETPSVVLRYGFDSTADVRIVEAVPRRSSAEGPVVGTDLSLATPGGDLRMASRLIGRPNAYNVLAATAAALALRIDPEQVRRGIESLEGVPGRMERVDAGQPFTVVVDYAHTPDALEKAIQTLSELPHRKLFTVFGCGGDRDRTKRPVMGRIASSGSDVVIATSDNPRTEDPEAILAEIERGMRQGRAQCSVRSDRRGAIRSALENAQAGDIVLIAGKGHETYQVVGKSTLPFDDRQVAREILAELGHGLEGP